MQQHSMQRQAFRSSGLQTRPVAAPAARRCRPGHRLRAQKSEDSTLDALDALGIGEGEVRLKKRQARLSPNAQYNLAPQGRQLRCFACPGDCNRLCWSYPTSPTPGSCLHWSLLNSCTRPGRCPSRPIHHQHHPAHARAGASSSSTTTQQQDDQVIWWQARPRQSAPPRQGLMTKDAQAGRFINGG